MITHALAPIQAVGVHTGDLPIVPWMYEACEDMDARRRAEAARHKCSDQGMLDHGSRLVSNATIRPHFTVNHIQRVIDKLLNPTPSHSDIRNIRFGLPRSRGVELSKQPG